MEVVAINIAPSLSNLSEWFVFLVQNGAGDFLIAQDTEDGRAVQAYNIQTLGTTIIIAPDGRIVYRDETTSTYEMLREGILLAQAH